MKLVTDGEATMAVSFKGAHFPQDIILTCVRWYVAYPLSGVSPSENRTFSGASRLKAV